MESAQIELASLLCALCEVFGALREPGRFLVCGFIFEIWNVQGTKFKLFPKYLVHISGMF
eukprot:1520585-Rhodomonas_salina.2